MIEDIFYLDEARIKLTAASVGIGRSRWTSIKKGDILGDNYKAIMQENRFDILPIISADDTVKEYFKTTEPNCYDNIQNQKINYKDVLPLDKSIRDIIKGFVFEKRAFYFLTYHSRITGLITLGNLNLSPSSSLVPGGRFRGLYYWDSYFTMLGLQCAGENELIRDIVKNFAYLIDAYGHIPNANRSYYLTRSQPPFFASMIRLHSEIDGPDVFTKYLPHMQKEYNYWMDGYFRLSDRETCFRRVILLPDSSILNRYWDDLPAPRPESYHEDVETAHNSAPDGVEPGKLYRHIRAACESGWDFTCRWFREETKIETIHTTDIVPVDLNCLLYDLEVTLSEAYEHSSFSEPSTYFHEKAEKRKKALNKNLWNDDRKYFMDYDSASNKSTEIMSLAGVFPLYFKIATKEQAQHVHEHITESFLKRGGVVSSLHKSGQQWDYPNGWAPMQFITYVGLRNYEFYDTAEELKKRWIDLNDEVFKETGKMMEKYNVVDTDSPAGGGEYPNQDGFGWTNGIYLWMKNNP